VGRQALKGPVAHPPRDVVAEVGDAGDAMQPLQRPAVRLDPGSGSRRLDPGFESAAAAWYWTDRPDRSMVVEPSL